jgi:hypothetical protein
MSPLFIIWSILFNLNYLLLKLNMKEKKGGTN